MHCESVLTFENTDDAGNIPYEELTAAMLLERGGTWELINGFKLKYRNNWDIKASFNIASAIHMPQYFSSTYEFERVRYNQAVFKTTHITANLSKKQYNLLNYN